MKILLLSLLWAVPFLSTAVEMTKDPITLTDTEARQAKVNMKKNHALIESHWQARLAMAKENDKNLAKPGMPLKKPYYGDSAMRH